MQAPMSTAGSRTAGQSSSKLSGAGSDAPVELRFAPELRDNSDSGWIKTIPEMGWPFHFRTYGLEAPAFNCGWQLPDLPQP
jgi:hypothetical protein